MKYVIRATKQSIVFEHDPNFKLNKTSMSYNTLYDPRNMTEGRLKLIEEDKQKQIDEYKSYYHTNLKKAILDNNLNYGTFQNWKSKNKIDYPIEFKGFLFEKVDVK